MGFWNRSGGGRVLRGNVPTGVPEEAVRVTGGMTPEIDVVRFAAAHTDGAFVLDVREPVEYLEGHVPGARLVPMAQLPGQVAELPRDQPVYVICAHGHRSYTAAGWLRRAGVDAISVAGGTVDWRGQGRPVVRGPQPDESVA